MRAPHISCIAVWHGFVGREPFAQVGFEAVLRLLQVWVGGRVTEVGGGSERARARARATGRVMGCARKMLTGDRSIQCPCTTQRQPLVSARQKLVVSTAMSSMIRSLWCKAHGPRGTERSRRQTPDNARSPIPGHESSYQPPTCHARRGGAYDGYFVWRTRPSFVPTL